MRSSRLLRLFFAFALLSILFIPSRAGVTSDEAAKLLPEQVGDFHAQKMPLPVPLRIFEHTALRPEDFDIVSAANTAYVSPTGQKFWVDIFQTSSDSGAYSLMSRNWAQGQFKKADGIGTYGFIFPQHALGFYKGANCVFIDRLGNQTDDDTELLEFARSFAQTLDAGSGEFPTLVTHLPNWEAVQARALYAISLPTLKETVRNQPILDAVSFEGGTEAVTAKYDQGQLVIIEFQTPQLAADNDARIGQRIAKLRAQNQAVLSAYRRVGNYAVFVFNAPSEQAANALIDQVKYEKVVQWLGNDPHRFERANRFWLNMSGSLIINTIKATALAILFCLGIGGIFGSVIFARRRAQAALREQYTDAGGMVRLNLDELAAQPVPSRLLPPGDD